MKIDKQALIKRKLERNDKLRADAKLLRSKKSKGGAQKYTEAYIIEKLSEKYYIAKKTVQNILNYHYEKAMNRGSNKKKTDPNQLTLFDLIPNEEIHTIPGPK